MNFLSRLKSGLTKTSSSLTQGITAVFTKRKLDDETLAELEEVLIGADVGAGVAAEMCAELARQKFGKEVSDEEVRAALAEHAAKLLEPVAKPLSTEGAKPFVILVVGVNGNGKTTTIGKLSLRMKREGKRVMMAAADTFRAAAVEQLEVWSKRADVPLIKGAAESDPASVAFRAIEEARAQGVDVLMVDTAGRLHNKSNLMAELQKIIKVIKKVDESAPHAVVQVLDATTGQNAIAQVEAFREMVGVTGLVVTKLDGTAKGGIIIALARKFALPIHAVGVGEAIEDLDVFDAATFARNLMAA